MAAETHLCDQLQDLAKGGDIIVGHLTGCHRRVVTGKAD